MPVKPKRPAVRQRAAQAAAQAPVQALACLSQPEVACELVEVTQRVVVTPHPMTLVGQRCYELANDDKKTVAHLLALAGLDAEMAAGYVVCLGGKVVPCAQQRHVRPYPGQLLEARPVVRDAITFAAFMYNAFAVSFAVSFAVYAFATTVLVNLAAAYIINKLLAPPKPKNNAAQSTAIDPVYGVTALRNAARPYEMVPILFGAVRVAPDYASNPYTYFDAEDQQLSSMFCYGANISYLDNTKIGATPLANYVGVRTATRGLGAVADQDFISWTDVDAVPGAALVTAGTVATPLVRVTSRLAVYIGIDLEFQCWATNGDGSFATNQYCGFYFQYRVKDLGGAWLNFFDATNNQGLPETPGLYHPQVLVNDGNGGFTIIPAYTDPTQWPGSVAVFSQTTKPRRFSFYRQVPSAAYEVRGYKTSVDVNTNRQVNEANWLNLKTYQNTPFNFAGFALQSINIKASKQLNGALDQLSAYAVANPIPLWVGGAWVTTYTSNVGAVLLGWLRGIRTAGGVLLAGFGLPDAQIDLDSFKGFMLHCAARGFTFNHWQTDLLSNSEMAEAIAKCGAGELSRWTGKFGVIWFNESQPVEAMVNMATIKADSFSVDYYTGETANEIEITYADGQGYNDNPQPKTIRVQSPVNTGAFDKVGRMSFVGIRSETHAAWMGRFAMGQNVYGRRSIRYETDFEYITYKKGSVVLISHDLTQWGYGGRLQAAVNNAGVVTLTLDEPVPSTNPAGSSVLRMVGLRLLGEVAPRMFTVQPFTGPARTLVLAGTWPAGIALPGSVAGEPAHECLWIYDFKATPGLQCRVTEVDVQRGTTGAKITLVPEPAEFWNYVNTGAYIPPTNNSLLNRQLPVASNIKVTEQLELQGSTYYTLLTATCTVTGNCDRVELWGRTTESAFIKIDVGTKTQFDWRGTLDLVWQLEVRPYDGLGRLGTVATLTYVVLGKTVPPQNMANLRCGVTNNGWLVSWDDPSDIDPDWQASELSRSSNFDVAQRITYKRSTTHLMGWLLAGVNTIYGRHWDEARPSTAGASVAVTVQAPSAPVLNKSATEFNRLNIQWMDSKTSQPIAGYFYQAARIVAGVEQAKVPWGGAGADSRSDTLPFTEAGDYNFYIYAVDVAGNIGAVSTFPFSIKLPNDFKNLLSTSSTFNGTMVNAAKSGPDGRVRMLVNTTETWGQHFASRGWANIAAQISAGYPLYFQPGTNTASYTEDTDMGKLFTVATVNVTLVSQVLSGSPTVTVTIGWSANGATWTYASPGVTSVAVTNVRYVRRIINAVGTGGLSLVELVSMQNNVNVQRVTENTGVLAILASDVNGTLYTTTSGFSDVTDCQMTEANTGTPVMAYMSWITDDALAPTVPAKMYFFARDVAGNRVSGNLSANIIGV